MHDFTHLCYLASLFRNFRRMFPVIRVMIEGLEPRAMYTILVEFVQLGNHRWKYMNGDWVAGGKSEPAPQPKQSVYMHPESPNFGAHWMKDPVTFTRVKLTNKPSAQTGQVCSDNKIRQFLLGISFILIVIL